MRKIIKEKVGILLITKWRYMQDDGVYCAVATDGGGRRQRNENEGEEEETAQHEYVNVCYCESA